MSEIQNAEVLQGSKLSKIDFFPTQMSDGCIFTLIWFEHLIAGKQVVKIDFQHKCPARLYGCSLWCKITWYISIVKQPKILQNMITVILWNNMCMSSRTIIKQFFSPFHDLPDVSCPAMRKVFCWWERIEQDCKVFFKFQT